MQDSAKTYRTFCYVDGFNLYYGLRESGFRRYMWLNIREMAARLVRSPFLLERTKYFTARISGKHPDDGPADEIRREERRKRQTLYLDALSTLAAFEIHEGHYLLKRDYCRRCKADFYRAEEKMTDVRIATELLTDAFLDRFDSAVIVSGDSDLVPPILSIREHFPHKPIVVAFPPSRGSDDLRQAATACMNVWQATLDRCQLPDEVHAGKLILRRPPEWR
jgi:uncharacterized LabA/DUF88 family protein